MEDTEEVKRSEFDCIRSPCESCEEDGLEMMLSREWRMALGIWGGIRYKYSH